MESSPFVCYLVRYYAEVKRHYPAEGRRRWRLRVAQEFWLKVGSLTGGSNPLEQDVLPEVTSTAQSDTDPDPMDSISRGRPEMGLVVRTDFSDETSWAAFCARLQDSEKELVSGDNDSNEDGEGDSDSDSEVEPPAIFRTINPSSPQERELLENASNLTILRLFNDVDVRPSPTPPQDTKRIVPPNRLVDSHGWQEYYRGKNVWIYDTKSNTDQCVRVVSQSGGMYGTATGDSWRAQVSHICEIQVHLSLGAIRIDFGGLDRWDFSERSRNMMEADIPMNT